MAPCMTRKTPSPGLEGLGRSEGPPLLQPAPHQQGAMAESRFHHAPALHGGIGN